MDPLRSYPTVMAVPESIAAVAKRLERDAHMQIDQTQGWVVIHNPELGKQQICLIVKTVHLPVR